ncbi:IspD/TarI family cytidylyltransferase [Pseudobutyrivibrio sp. LB2011]|uniref:IspD/TarI family cytidylyltransferase n=1 Tax=Pseudobutyrivibrio sp. LB2011 TaxID=1408312 RepID=UPI0005D1D29A|nr:IspD/TarI family cytidylyltransferase [Pseudobutyrivibrio sp. LB2011]
MNIAIVLAGGVGARLGADVPKAFVPVCQKPLIIYSLECLSKNSHIDKIQIVAAEDWMSQVEEWTKEYEVHKKVIGFSVPGETRQLSIYNALMDLKQVAKVEDNVFIHDAARPLLSEDLIARSFIGMEGYDGVLPVLPMTDTVYLSKGGQQIDSLLNREEIYAGQAPETFVYGKYLEANQVLKDSGEIYRINGSTEPAVMADMKIHLIPGDENNFKITTQADLDRFVEIVKGR